MNSLPIIKLSVEGMKTSMLHAFTKQQLEISSEVQRAIELECTPEKIQTYINEESQKIVSQAIKDAIRQWWLTSPEGQSLIQSAVVERMNEEAKIYSDRKV